jgi:hypothetical protein
VLLNFLNYQASVELHHSFIEKVAQQEKSLDQS